MPGAADRRGLTVQGRLAPDELQTVVLCLEMSADGDVNEQGRYEHEFRPVMTRAGPNVRKRAVHEIAEPGQAPAQYRARIPIDADGAPLHDIEGEERRIQHVPDLVRDLPHALQFFGRSRHCGETGMLCDGV